MYLQNTVKWCITLQNVSFCNIASEASKVCYKNLEFKWSEDNFGWFSTVLDWTTQILFDFLAKIDWVKFGSLESFGKLPEIENSEVKSLMLIAREIL